MKQVTALFSLLLLPALSSGVFAADEKSEQRDLGPFTNDAASKDDETTFDFYVETSDFKEVNGVKLPFRLVVVATAPILRQKSAGTIVATINEYRGTTFPLIRASSSERASCLRRSVQRPTASNAALGSK